MLWLALHFPRLPLEVLMRGMEHPPPLVVQDDAAVLLASPSAQQAGIQPGMRLATARTLSDHLRVLARQPGKEQQALRLLAVRLLDFTPRVSPFPPDGLVLEVGGCIRLFRGLSPLLQGILETLQDSGFSATPALGPTPLAAWQLTRLPLPQSLACLENDRADEQAFRSLLSQLPLNSLHLPQRLRRKLSAPGFSRLGDILALPRDTLGKRYGRDFLIWLEKLLGERPDPQVPLRPPVRFSATLEFPDPVENSAGLIFPMQRLLEDLAHHLRLHQQSVSAIRWHFRPLKGDTDRLVIRRARPCHEVSDWLMLTRRHLEHFQLRDPVLELSLDTEKPRRRTVEANTFFRDPEERPDQTLLLEKLASLPGLSCYTPRENDEPLPEASEQRHAPMNAPEQATVGASPFSERPLWLFDPPQPLTLYDEQPEWLGERLEWLPGEERLSSHWWQAHNHVREYRIARHPNGFCCWLFRERRSGRWYIQGLF